MFVLVFTGCLKLSAEFQFHSSYTCCKLAQKMDLITADRQFRASVLKSITRYLGFMLKHHFGNGILCPLSLCLCVTAWVEAP